MQKIYTRGRSVSQGGLTLGVIGLAVFLLLSVSQHVGASSCGPGAHWVDTCASGTDTIPSSVGTLKIDLNFDGVADMTVNLTNSGPTTVFRGPGAPHQIDTEMVSLQLIGGGLTVNAGDGIGNLLCDGPLCSPGAIIEQGGNSALADSFFDVFFEILGTPVGRLHNNVPLHIEAVIDRVPPPVGTAYDPLPPCPQQEGCLLFDDNNDRVAQLVDPTHHLITPEPSTLLLLGSGLAGIIGLVIRRRLSQKA